MTPDCLKDLQRLHFPISLLDVQEVVIAAKCQVLHSDNLADGGLHIRERAIALRSQLSNPVSESALCFFQ